jgi:hypothetical protein
MGREITLGRVTTPKTARTDSESGEHSSWTTSASAKQFQDQVHGMLQPGTSALFLMLEKVTPIMIGKHLINTWCHIDTTASGSRQKSPRKGDDTSIRLGKVAGVTVSRSLAGRTCQWR